MTFGTIQQWLLLLRILFCRVDVRRKMYARTYTSPGSNVKLTAYNRVSRPMYISLVQNGQIFGVYSYSDAEEYKPMSCSERFPIRPCDVSDYAFSVNQCNVKTSYREIAFYKVSVDDKNKCSGGMEQPIDEATLVPCNYVPISSGMGLSFWRSVGSDFIYFFFLSGQIMKKISEPAVVFCHQYHRAHFLSCAFSFSVDFTFSCML